MNKSDGFTILEVLVALAILGLSLGMVMTSISNGLRLTRESASETAAGVLAQSLLDRVGGDLPLQDSEIHGTEPDGTRWRVQISPYGSSLDRAVWPLDAKSVSSTVSWGSGGPSQTIMMTSLRLAPIKPPQ